MTAVWMELMTLEKMGNIKRNLKEVWMIWKVITARLFFVRLEVPDAKFYFILLFFFVA